MLATDSSSTWMVFRRLRAKLGVDRVVIEEPISAVTLLKARARRLGWWAAAGQVAFRLGVMPVVERLGRRRQQEIVEEHGLDATPADESRIARVPSINHPSAVAALRALAPRVVVVTGSRIIRQEVLEAIPATFLNMHAGITPRYRGVHGAYWALAAGDREHCGVTVHLVDPGVDTGDVVAQACIEPTARDTFATYPVLQLATGLPLLVAAVEAAMDGDLEAAPADGPSRQWYHPTAWGYLRTWRRRGVR
jgi:methionyl-tRNA formyltransferase